METVIGSFYTISNCLKVLLNPLFTNLIGWKAINKDQEKLLKIFETTKEETEKIKEITWEIGLGNVDPVNIFLAKNNFDIRLNPIGQGDVAIASVLDLLLKWLSVGRNTIILKNPKIYSAVFSSYARIVQNSLFPNPMAILPTQTEDKVFMTIIDEQPKDAFEVFDLACKLVGKYEDISEFDGVTFPKIDLDIQPSLSWLVGLKVKNNWWNISQALQQTKLKMNEEGVHIKEAVALSVSGSIASAWNPPMVIDKPFLLVVTRPTLKLPLFAAFLAEDCWKDPKDLIL